MKSNLDLARECFADVRETADGTPVIAFYDDELDAFAERIRAEAMADYAAMTANGAKAWADVPDATKWVDELRGSDAIDTSAEYVEKPGWNVQMPVVAYLRAAIAKEKVK